MKIDLKTIAHLEQLARIQLSQAEREQVATQLARIVEFCEQIQAIDTDKIAPTAAVVYEKHTTLRPDEVKPGLDRDVVLKMAPDAKDGFFRVPKIIER
jgi:aspartyl-tRNA(Asn)/glutamyl-tRNA(Gln) amidotransferase subunit C